MGCEILHVRYYISLNIIISIKIIIIHRPYCPLRTRTYQPTSTCSRTEVKGSARRVPSRCMLFEEDYRYMSVATRILHDAGFALIRPAGVQSWDSYMRSSNSASAPHRRTYQQSTFSLFQYSILPVIIYVQLSE